MMILVSSFITPPILLHQFSFALAKGQSCCMFCSTPFLEEVYHALHHHCSCLGVDDSYRRSSYYARRCLLHSLWANTECRWLCWKPGGLVVRHCVNRHRHPGTNNHEVTECWPRIGPSSAVAEETGNHAALKGSQAGEVAGADSSVFSEQKCPP